MISNWFVSVLSILVVLLFTYSFYISAKYKVELEDNQWRKIGIAKCSNELNQLKQKIIELKYDNKMMGFKNKIWRFKNPQRDYIIETVYRKAMEHGVDPILMVAIIQRESNFDVWARSKVAVGLMQVNYSVWKDEFNLSREEELYDIERNIDVGIQIFKHYLDISDGDVGLALHRFNNGFLYNNTKYTPAVMDRYFKIKGGTNAIRN